MRSSDTEIRAAGPRTFFDGGRTLQAQNAREGQIARMKEMTKSQKRHLRDLAATAYDRELSAALGELHGQFGRQQAREIDARNLNEFIHCTVVDRRIVMLHQYIKKSEKTPRKELEIAYKRMKEVKNA